MPKHTTEGDAAVASGGSSNNGSSDQTPPTWTPPYMGWANFRNLLDKLHTNLPPRIDRTFLTGSNATITIMLAGLRSLDLINSEKRPTPVLTTLATDAENRKSHLAALLRRFYPEAVELGAVNGTQGQLEEAFGKWGIAGDTRRKAIAFYLAAARFAELPVSTNFRTPAISRSDGAPVKRGAGKRKHKTPQQQDNGSVPPDGSATSAPPADDGMDSLRHRFLEVLVDKVASDDKPDAALLDRVQSLLFGGKLTGEGKAGSTRPGRRTPRPDPAAGSAPTAQSAEDGSE